MGLKITRMHRSHDVRRSTPSRSRTNTESVWSARDLCPAEWSGADEPLFAERVVPNANGHLEAEQISKLFDRLWELTGAQTQFIAELDMSDVKTTEPRFTGELEFLRRRLVQKSSVVRLINFDPVNSVIETQPAP